MEAEFTIVLDIPIYIARYNGIINLREESIEEANSPILPIPCTAIFGDGLNLGATVFNSSLKLARNEQANSAFRSTRLQGALLGTCQIRSVFCAIIGAVGVLHLNHIGECCVGRREDDSLYISSGPF